MEKRATLTIACTANGWVVKEELENSADVPIIDDFFVFQKLGYASSMEDGVPSSETLLGWLEQHFKLEVPK